MTTMKVKLTRPQIWYLLWLDRYETGKREERWSYGQTTKRLHKLGLLDVKVLDEKYPKDVVVSLTDEGISAAQQLRNQGFNVSNTSD